MTDISRLRVSLTNFPGGPGVATYYAIDPTLCVPILKTLWGTLAQQLPSNVHITYPLEGDVLDHASGAIVGTWNRAAVTDDNGDESGVYSAPSGACIIWRTNVVVAGRRLRGKTFVVPLSGASYEADGSIGIAPLATIRAAATACAANVSDGRLLVWHRPTSGVGGEYSQVTSATVTDRAAVLRSRRI